VPASVTGWRGKRNERTVTEMSSQEGMDRGRERAGDDGGGAVRIRSRSGREESLVGVTIGDETSWT
jgi:hypothetical protein